MFKEKYCCICEDYRYFELVYLSVDVLIRGKPITASCPHLICSVCGEKQPNDDPDNDSMKPLYDEYFKQTGERCERGKIKI